MINSSTNLEHRMNTVINGMNIFGKIVQIVVKSNDTFHVVNC